MDWQRPITDLHGIGPAAAAKFKLLGITTALDLATYWPRRYDDYSLVTPIAKLQPGPVSIEGVIKQAKGRYVRRGMHLTEAVISDQTGSTRLIWFNQPYRETSLKRGQPYFISGNYELSHQRFAIMNPAVELKSDFPLNTARIVPVYKETKGLNSRQIRQAISQLLPFLGKLPDTLPAWLTKEQHLMAYGLAASAMHFPESSEMLGDAKRRLAFEEVFRLSLASLLNKQANQQESGVVIAFQEKLAQKFVGELPFKLTNDQRQTIWQIYLDLQKEAPMNRLVEGDVGSGKTVVATMAALMVIAAGYQVAFMAPTELLARQHADTIVKLLESVNLADQVTLLVGSQTAAQKAKARAAIKAGHASFVVGTQALIQDALDMHKLALVIIDEQHRFGVEQRKKLMAKAGHMPHVVSLTATPIPRSLALTLYGELDVSVLATKPAGRQIVHTELVSPNSRRQLYDKLQQQLQQERQIFVVCPLITDSAVVAANSAEKVYQELRDGYFKQWRIGLLHGRLKSEEKNDVMNKFVSHELDIVVATTVIEVGVDVPNASVMLIENPERFGLAQLHQLRGRVGRGQHAGYCYLMLSDSSAPSKRLRALASSHDGFALSELDLEVRGPGAIYGTLQHGQLDLRIAKLSDTQLIAEARQAAGQFIEKRENLLNYEQLHQEVSRLRSVTNLN